MSNSGFTQAFCLYRSDNMNVRLISSNQNLFINATDPWSNVRRLEGREGEREQTQKDGPNSAKPSYIIKMLTLLDWQHWTCDWFSFCLDPKECDHNDEMTLVYVLFGPFEPTFHQGLYSLVLPTPFSILSRHAAQTIPLEFGSGTGEGHSIQNHFELWSLM